jgi:hypothetical protein
MKSRINPLLILVLLAVPPIAIWRWLRRSGKRSASESSPLPRAVRVSGLPPIPERDSELADPLPRCDEPRVTSQEPETLARESERPQVEMLAGPKAPAPPALHMVPPQEVSIETLTAEVMAVRPLLPLLFSSAAPESAVPAIEPAPSGVHDLPAVSCSGAAAEVAAADEEKPKQRKVEAAEPVPVDGAFLQTGNAFPEAQTGQDQFALLETQTPPSPGARTADAEATAPILEITSNGASRHTDRPGVEAAGIESPVPAQTPHRYQPPVQRPPRQQSQQRTDRTRGRVTSLNLDLEIRVHLRLDRFDFCDIALSPQRLSGMDDEVVVTLSGSARPLAALEDWYEDLRLDDIGQRLRDGLEMKARLSDGRRCRWLLTGRDLFVLAHHGHVSAFVSVTRLVLGRTHILLCTTALLPSVEAILVEAGCRGYVALSEANGLPAGWSALKGVVPTAAIPLGSGSDNFYAIKPPPDIEIELDGGIWFRNSAWLVGFPPQIKVFGQLPDSSRVLIDGREAIKTEQNSFTVEGYDALGPHTVFCEGLSCSKSYSIEQPPDTWDDWPAYNVGKASICGPLVKLSPSAANERIFQVPMSNPLLIGAEPGQIFHCPQRQGSVWKGAVPFEVVWALPRSPLIADKKVARILQFASASPMPFPRRYPRPLGWSYSILDAARKGLRLAKDSPESVALWKQYKQMAHAIRRAKR